MTDDDVGTLYTIWLTDGTSALVDPEDAALIDRAMKLWSDSGHTRDTWLSLHQPSGIELSVLASTITSSAFSNSAQREIAVMREKAITDERKEYRARAGFIESDD